MAQDNGMLRPHQTFLDGLAAGELRYQRCGACDAAVFYPRVACNVCGSDQLTFATSAGTGTVYSNTATMVRDKPAYSIALVDLDEGFRVMTTVLGIDAEDVAIGMRVAAAFEPPDGDQDARLVFYPEVTRG